MSMAAAVPPDEARVLREQLAASRSACIREAESTSATAQRVTRALDDANRKRTAERRVHEEATCTLACCAQKEKTS